MPLSIVYNVPLFVDFEALILASSNFDEVKLIYFPLAIGTLVVPCKSLVR